MIKFKKLFKKGRKLGTSPIIATIMLIGLTVFSGAVLFTVMTAYDSSQTALNLSYDSQAVYKSSASQFVPSSSKVDTVQISVSNPNLEQMVIDLAGSKLYNSNNKLLNWTAVQNTGAYLTLNGKQSAIVTFQCFNVNDLLNIGDQYYAIFAIMTPDLTNPTTVTTSTFTITQTNYLPDFQFVPTVSSTTQQGTDVYFFANYTESATVDITGVLWNLGNPDTSYQKSIQFLASNPDNFTVDSQYTGSFSKTVTIPASTNVGYYDPSHPDVCVAGYACANISIPVTKNVNTTLGAYNGILTITGMDLTPFQLYAVAPTVRITLENTNYRNWGFFNWRRGQNNCPSAPNWNNDNQQGNTISFYGSPSCTDTKTVTFDIWNLLDTPNTANIEISGLNTTAFTLLTSADSTRWNSYDSNPQTVSLTAGPGRTYRWFTYCRLPSQQACNTVTWGIARNPLVDSNGNPTGIEAGYYPITVTDLLSGTQQQFQLYIQPYAITVHVASITGSYSTRYNTLSYKVTVEDADGQTVRFVQVTADYTYPNGNGKGNTKTVSETAYTDWSGVATFTNFNPKNGKNTLLVTDLSSFSFGNRGRWSRFSSTVIIYDSSANTPNPPQYTVNV